MTQDKIRSIFLDFIPFRQMRIVKTDLYATLLFIFFLFFAFSLLCIQLLVLRRSECFVNSRQVVTTVIKILTISFLLYDRDPKLKARQLDTVTIISNATVKIFKFYHVIQNAAV